MPLPRALKATSFQFLGWACQLFAVWAAMRAFAASHPGRVGIFQMELWNGTVLWSEPVLRYGNVGSPMFVVPNIPDKLGEWPNEYCGDYFFIQKTVDLQGEPIYHPGECIALIKPEAE